jgi:di/tricarboxylate transporter
VVGIICFLRRIAPAVTAMMGLCAFLCTGVLQWKDCLAETAAWDTLSWFAVLIGMSGASCFHADVSLLSLSFRWP